MQPQTFIFFGPSGSGKGKQSELLMAELEKKDPERRILYLETGEKFRDFIKGNSLSSKLTKEVLDKGKLVPEFLPIWIWTDFLVRNFSGREHLFFDGSPRKLEEAKILDLAIKFYKIENPVIVSIEVSDKWAARLMEKRGRADDTDEEIKSRLAWYKENTMPAVEYFKNDPDYKFVSVNGEQTIEEVHRELMEKVGL